MDHILEVRKSIGVKLLSIMTVTGRYEKGGLPARVLFKLERVEFYVHIQTGLRTAVALVTSK